MIKTILNILLIFLFATKVVAIEPNEEFLNSKLLESCIEIESGNINVSKFITVKEFIEIYQRHLNHNNVKTKEWAKTDSGYELAIESPYVKKLTFDYPVNKKYAQLQAVDKGPLIKNKNERYIDALSFIYIIKNSEIGAIY